MTLDEAFQSRLQQIAAGDKDDHCTCPRMACNPIPLAKLINFALTWDIEDVLPTAYYMGLVNFTLDVSFFQILYNDSHIIHWYIFRDLMK